MNGWHTQDIQKLYCVTIDMIEAGEAALLDIQNNILHHGQYTTCILSYDRFCRGSELFWCPLSNHHLLSKSVQFIVVPEGEVFTGILPQILEFISGDLIYNYPLNRIAGHDLFLIDSKNDPQGKSQSNPHTRLINRGPSSVTT